MKRNAPTFSASEIVDALRLCPFTPYRIAAETGLSQPTIRNYLSGRYKPNQSARRLLAQYLRLIDYVAYQDLTPEEDRKYSSYAEFIKASGYAPIVENDARPVGFTSLEEAEAWEATRKIADAAALIKAKTTPADYMQFFAPLRDELEAAHNLISTMRESNAFLMAEVSKLRALIPENQ